MGGAWGGGGGGAFDRHNQNDAEGNSNVQILFTDILPDSIRTTAIAKQV